MVAHAVVPVLALSGCILDNGGNLFTLCIIHVEEHLLTLAVLWLVVVNKQVTKDPLITLQPGLEAAANSFAASSASFILIRLGLLLIGVESEVVLTCVIITVMAFNFVRDLILREQVGLHGANGGTEEDRGEDDEGEASSNNDGAVLNVAPIDSEDETEGDSASDQTCVADEEDFLPLDARVVTT